MTHQTKWGGSACDLPEKEAGQKAVERMQSHGFSPVPSFNRYWDRTGKTFEDADGYRIVLQHGAWFPQES